MEAWIWGMGAEESSGVGMGSSASLLKKASHMDGAASASGCMKSGSSAVCLMLVRESLMPMKMVRAVMRSMSPTASDWSTSLMASMAEARREFDARIAGDAEALAELGATLVAIL
jgi:hypothetical protein